MAFLLYFRENNLRHSIPLFISQLTRQVLVGGPNQGVLVVFRNAFPACPDGFQRQLGK
ncbi:hypothetical protein [Coxiella burnetii]|uniref:hypothetical protein n=1 Tax=Coxiella burnetii TaxID=777 RepID=UPI0018AD26EE|nr:hypothetical protein [Coxiella burnetii]